MFSVPHPEGLSAEFTRWLQRITWKCQNQMSVISFFLQVLHMLAAARPLSHLLPLPAKPLHHFGVSAQAVILYFQEMSAS